MNDTYDNSNFSLISATTTNNGTKVYVLPKVSTSGSVVNLLADSNLKAGTGVQIYDASGGGVKISSFMVAGTGIAINETSSGALIISSSGSSSSNYADYVIKDPDNMQAWRYDTLTNTVAASYKNIASGSSGLYYYKLNFPDYSGTYLVTLPTGSGTLALKSEIPTTYVKSIGGKTGAITLSGLSMVNNVLTNPATGSLAKKNSATGNSPAVTFNVISNVSDEDHNWGWQAVTASSTISFIESIDNYDYLYIEGVNDDPLSGSTANADCSHIFIPVGIWKIYASTAHTLSLSNYSSRARIYYKSSTSMGVDKTLSLNWLRVFGVKRGTITVS